MRLSRISCTMAFAALSICATSSMATTLNEPLPNQLNSFELQNEPRLMGSFLAQTDTVTVTVEFKSLNVESDLGFQPLVKNTSIMTFDDFGANYTTSGYTTAGYELPMPDISSSGESKGADLYGNMGLLAGTQEFQEIVWNAADELIPTLEYGLVAIEKSGEVSLDGEFLDVSWMRQDSEIVSMGTHLYSSVSLDSMVVLSGHYKAESLEAMSFPDKALLQTSLFNQGLIE